MKSCNACAIQLPATAKFCGQCGGPVTANKQRPAVTPAAESIGGDELDFGELEFDMAAISFDEFGADPSAGGGGAAAADAPASSASLTLAMGDIANVMDDFESGWGDLDDDTAANDDAFGDNAVATTTTTTTTTTANNNASNSHTANAADFGGGDLGILEDVLDGIDGALDGLDEFDQLMADVGQPAPKAGARPTAAAPANAEPAGSPFFFTLRSADLEEAAAEAAAPAPAAVAPRGRGRGAPRGVPRGAGRGNAPRGRGGRGGGAAVKRNASSPGQTMYGDAAKLRTRASAAALSGGGKASRAAANSQTSVSRPASNVMLHAMSAPAESLDDFDIDAEFNFDDDATGNGPRGPTGRVSSTTNNNNHNIQPAPNHHAPVRTTPAAAAVPSVDGPRRAAPTRTTSLSPRTASRDVVAEDTTGVGDSLSAKAVRMLGRDAAHTDSISAHDMRGFEWYHGTLSADAAFKLLRSQPKGTFLVRKSSRPGAFVVSWCRKEKTIVHTLLSATDRGWRMDGETGKLYTSIYKAVTSHPNSFAVPIAGKFAKMLN